jgi:hypothetical protein
MPASSWLPEVTQQDGIGYTIRNKTDDSLERCSNFSDLISLVTIDEENISERLNL